MTSTQGSGALDRLVARIHDLEQRVDTLARTPQLANSSMEGGAVTVYQPGTGGLPGAVLGQQSDGTFGAVALGGPVPPVPTAPGMDTVTSGARLTWHGDFVQTTDDRVAGRPTVAPQDFKAVEFQVSQSPDFPGDVTTRGGIYISSAAGGYSFAPWAAGTQLYARARAWSMAGKFSAWSLTAGPVEAGKVGVGDLGFDLSTLAGTRVFYGPTDPNDEAGVTVSYGDLWLKETAAGPPPQYQSYRWTPAEGTSPDRWVQLADQGATGALEAAVAAQEAAAAKASLFTQPTAPAWSGAAGTAYWVDTGNGNRPMVWTGTAWAAYRLGNGAITPNSLVASDVVATGTVSASLLEAIMVLVTAIIAGDPAGTHAAMKPDGLHIYDDNGSEVARLGTSTNDYFGIVNSLGQLLASIDDTGHASFSGLTVDGDLWVRGTKFVDWVGAASGSGNGNRQIPGAEHMIGWADGSISGIGDGGEVGIVEAVVNVSADRWYWIGFDMSIAAGPDTAADIRIRDGGTSSPTITSPAIMFRRIWSLPTYQDTSAFRMGVWYPSTSGQHRLGLTVFRGAGAGVIDVRTLNALPGIICIDMGPRKPIAASVNRMGGGTSPPPPPAAPTQQYYVELAPTARATFRGNGVQRSDTTDIVQGWDPSGFNGDGSGWWVFNLPTITGTVDRVDWYVYTNQTYYNSGGRALWRPIHTGPPNWPIDSIALKGAWDPGANYPKPGGVTVTVPADWWPLFAGSGSPSSRAIGIAAGPSGGSNENYYCRFDGPSARLRIWYTQ